MLGTIENDIPTNRLYSDLAWLRPLWGDVSKYGPNCENVLQLIKKHARRELNTLDAVFDALMIIFSVKTNM